MDIFKSEIFWSALSAIGTIAAAIVATVVALWQMYKPLTRKLEVSKTFIEKGNDGIIEMSVTLDNVGDVGIIITDCGLGMTKIRSEQVYVTYKNIEFIAKERVNILDESMNKYIINNEFPLLIKAGDSKLIKYRYDFKKAFFIGDETISKKKEYKLFKNSIIVLRDSRNNSYLG